MNIKKRSKKRKKEIFVLFRMKHKNIIFFWMDTKAHLQKTAPALKFMLIGGRIECFFFFSFSFVFSLQLALFLYRFIHDRYETSRTARLVGRLIVLALLSQSQPHKAMSRGDLACNL